MRLCILTKFLKSKIFNLIYNKMKDFAYARIYKKLIRNIYIFNIYIKLYKYLRHYFNY